MGAISLNVNSFSAEAAQGTDPGQQFLEVSNSVSGSLTFTVAVTAGSSWLSVTPTSGTVPNQTTNVTVTLTFTPSEANLAFGLYTGAITLVNVGSSIPNIVIPVTLTVTAPTTLTSSATFTILPGPATPPQATVSVPVIALPSTPGGTTSGVGGATQNVSGGTGRLIHPGNGTFIGGAFDYEEKPDSWSNIDGDIIVPPTWLSTKTLNGDTNALWSGFMADVICEEKWTQPMAMPVAQLRMLLNVWMNPVDPAVAYVQWWPSYTNQNGYNVIPISLKVGSGNDITLTDLVNAVNADGSNNGWVEGPITFSMKIVGKVGT